MKNKYRAKAYLFLFSDLKNFGSSISIVILIIGFLFSSKSALAADQSDNNVQIKSRTYISMRFAHNLGRSRDLSDSNPGYGASYFEGDILEDSDETTTHLAVTKVICPDPEIVTGEKCLSKGGEYYMSAKLARNVKRISDGIITGILAVPFKYHFSDHAVTSGATLGAYVGYEKEWSWIGSAAWVVGGGLALVPTSTTTTNFVPNATSPPSGSQTVTSTSDSSLNGITIATGLIARIGKTNAQFGVMLGTDLVNKSNKYKYDGKPWLSFSFAYSFSDQK